MLSINEVNLMGYVTKDPEVKTLASGAIVATFTVATNYDFVDKNNEKQSETEWNNIVAWNKSAEIVGKYLKKGAPVHVTGRLKTRKWEDEAGGKHQRTEIIMDRMIMLPTGKQQNDYSDPGPQDNDTGYSAPTSSRNAPASATPPSPEPEYESEIRPEDLPF